MKYLAKAMFWVFLPFMPLHAQNDDRPYDRSLEPAKSFHHARNLIEAKQFEDAHAVHEKMFSDIGNYRPNVFFLYVYNLTYDWHRAAKKHPPAMTSMLKHRDALEDRLSQLREDGQDPSIEDRIDLLTVFSFNEWLNEDARSADLFATIEERFPNLADEMYFHCKDALIRANRYSTVSRYEPDPKLIFELASKGFEVTIQARPDLKDMARERFESAIINSLDAFWATGEEAKAKELRKLALEFLDSEKLRKHIPNHKPNGG